MRCKILWSLIILLGLLVTFGCIKTPESSQVRETKELQVEKVEERIAPTESIEEKLTAMNFKPEILPGGITILKVHYSERSSLGPLDLVKAKAFDKFLSDEAGVPITTVTGLTIDFSESSELMTKDPFNRIRYTEGSRPPSPQIDILEFESEDQAKSLESVQDTSAYGAKIIQGQKVYYYKDAQEIAPGIYYLPEYIWYFKNFRVRLHLFISNDITEEILKQIITQVAST